MRRLNILRARVTILFAAAALAIAGTAATAGRAETVEERHRRYREEYTESIRDLYLSENPSRSWGDWGEQIRDAWGSGLGYRHEDHGDTLRIWKLTPAEEAQMREGQAYYREGIELEQKRRWKDGVPPEQRLISEIEASLARFFEPKEPTDSKETPLSEQRAKRAALRVLSIPRESDVKASPFKVDYLRRKNRGLLDAAPPPSASERRTFAQWKSETIRRLEKADVDLTRDLFLGLQRHVRAYRIRAIESAREGANGARSDGGEQVVELGSPACGNLLEGFTEILPVSTEYVSSEASPSPGSTYFLKKLTGERFGNREIEALIEVTQRPFAHGPDRFMARRADGSKVLLEIVSPTQQDIPIEPSDLLRNHLGDLRDPYFPAIAALQDYELKKNVLWRLHAELDRARSQKQFRTVLTALKSEVSTSYRRPLPHQPSPELIGIKYGALKKDPLFWIKREEKARARGASPFYGRDDKTGFGTSRVSAAEPLKPRNDPDLKDHPSLPEERYRISGRGSQDFIVASRVGASSSSYLRVPAAEEVPSSPTALAMRSRGAMPLASSFLPLPTPERHWIQGLSLRSGDGKLLEPGVDYTVHDTQDRSAYYVRFLAGRRPERVSVEARFEPMPEGEWPGLPPDFDPRLLEIAPSRLHESIRLLREAGFADLSARLAGLALRAEERRRPISIPEVEAEFARSGRYSFVPEKAAAAPNPDNPFSEYSNLAHEGRLCAQCNGFEPVLTALLNQIFKDQPRIRFSSMVTIRSRSRLPGLKQQLDLGWISHQRTTLLIDGVTRAVLDGTAGQMDPRNPFRWRNTWLARMLTQREIGRPRFLAKLPPTQQASATRPPERIAPGSDSPTGTRALANAAVVRHAAALEESRASLLRSFEDSGGPGRDLDTLKSVYALVDVKRQYLLGGLDEAGARERLKRFFGEQAVEPIRDPQSLLGFVRAKAEELELRLDGLARKDSDLVEKKLPWLARSSRELFEALEKLHSPEEDVTPIGVVQHRAFAQGERSARSPGECLRETLFQDQGAR